jgi:hypothetical protein
LPVRNPKSLIMASIGETRAPYETDPGGFG